MRRRTTYIILVIALALSGPALVVASEKADFVYVDKSESRLYLSRNGKIFKSFKVSFGSDPVGHKLREGDKRTPEGLYLLDYKKENSDFYRAIRISYPNRDDRRRAKAQGVNPGGGIMIHGQKKGMERFTQISLEYNWTDGCIAAANGDLDEIWAAIDIPTPIRIMP